MHVGLKHTRCEGLVTQAAASPSLCMCRCILISHVVMCDWGGPVIPCASLLHGSAQEAASLKELCLFHGCTRVETLNVSVDCARGEVYAWQVWGVAF